MPKRPDDPGTETPSNGDRRMKACQVALPDHPKYRYLKQQIARVGDRDPLDVLAATPLRLTELTAHYDDEAFSTRIEAGVWTPREILAHLADCEWLFGQRMRSILGDPNPVLIEADQERWLIEQRANERATTEWLEDFRALRPVNLRFWRRLPRERFGRTGHHDGADIDMSLSFLLPLQAGHDLSHLEQMEQRLSSGGESARP